MASEQSGIKSFPAELESLYSILKIIREFSLQKGFSHSTVHQIELATEEALVNIIEYAYPEQVGTIEVEVGTQDNQWLWIKIEDRGIPFDPLKHAKKFLVKSMKTNHTIGGYGTYLITEIMDRVEYRRKGEVNCLTLFKQLPQIVE